jgi:tetratricopeptide (TPR) repeat protein
MKDYEKAIRDYTHAILIDNQDSNAFLGRADAFRLQGNLDAAIKDYEAVANIMNGPNIGDGEITDNKDQAAQAYNY